MTGVEVLARQRRSEGVDTVLALPGVQIMIAFDALEVPVMMPPFQVVQ